MRKRIFPNTFSCCFTTHRYYTAKFNLNMQGKDLRQWLMLSWSCWSAIMFRRAAWVWGVAGWKSLAMWFTLHHNQITLPGIPPAKPTTQHSVWEEGAAEEEEGMKKREGGEQWKNDNTDTDLKKDAWCGEQRLQVRTDREMNEYRLQVSVWAHTSVVEHVHSLITV